MEEDEFSRISSLDAFPADGSLSVTAETFSVIKRQQRHRQFRAAQKFHRQDRNLKKYISRSSNGSETMSQIATSVGFSPCMLARLLLEAKFGWSKTTISNFFKEAMKDEAEQSAEPNRRGLSEEEYNLLLQEVRECIEEDADCSPFADRVRHNMGAEYEYLLLESLRNRQLVFESEDMLREKGLAKTPDVRLLLPIGVVDPSTGQLHVVNWIDSKAMFGDRHTHESENLEQLQGYVNRYGPGMVIYWFGHVANLSSDRDIYITDSFPNDITLPGAFDPLATVSKVKEGGTLPLQPPKSQQESFDEGFTPVTTCEL